MPIDTAVTSDRRTLTDRCAQITALLFLAGLIFLGFSAWLDASSFNVLAGDDLRSFTYANESFTAYNDFFIQFYRYRPTQAAVGRAAAILSGGDFSQLRMIAIGIHSLNALLLLGLMVRSLKVPLLVAFAVTVVASFSRFTNYLIMAETGIAESFGVTLYLSFVWTLLALLRRPRLPMAAASAMLFTLIIHTHERYLVLFAATLAVSFLIYRLSRSVSIFLSATNLVVILVNILIKAILLHTPILVGTTTQAIDLSLRPKIIFFFSGLLNLTGVNRGPSYLSVLDYLDSPLWLKAISLVSMAFCLWLLVGAAVTARTTTKSSTSGRTLHSFWPVALLLVLLTLVMVLSSSITFRQEYRWFYPGFLTFLLLMAGAAQTWHNHSRSRVPNLVLCGFLLAAIPRELAIRSQRSNFYQFTTCQTASAFYEAYTRSPTLSKTKLITIGGDPVPDTSWVFMDGLFSRYYHIPPLQFRESFIPDGAVSTPALLRYDSSRKIFYEAPRSPDGKLLPEHNSDLLAKAGIIGPTEHNLSTPNGMRLLPFSSGGFSGWAMVAPVKVRIEIPRAAHILHVSFSHLWQKAGAMHLELSAIDDTNEHRILSTSIPPLQEASTPEWQDYQIPLPANCRTLNISISPDGDQSATWLMFRQFIMQ